MDWLNRLKQMPTKISAMTEVRDNHCHDVYVVDPNNVAQTVTPLKVRSNDDLRKYSYVPDLAAVIVELTGDNMLLQQELLTRYCEAYDHNHIPHLWELFVERAAIMEYDGGLYRDEAEIEAAHRLNLQAFLEERKDY